MTAYDYKAQKWVEGAEAARCIIDGTQKELAILTGPQGLAYQRNIGDRRPLAERIDMVRNTQAAAYAFLEAL